MWACDARKTSVAGSWSPPQGFVPPRLASLGASSRVFVYKCSAPPSALLIRCFDTPIWSSWTVKRSINIHIYEESINNECLMTTSIPTDCGASVGIKRKESFSRPPTPIVMSPATRIPALCGDKKVKDVRHGAALLGPKPGALSRPTCTSRTSFLRDGVASQMSAPINFPPRRSVVCFLRDGVVVYA